MSGCWWERWGQEMLKTPERGGIQGVEATIILYRVLRVLYTSIHFNPHNTPRGIAVFNTLLYSKGLEVPWEWPQVDSCLLGISVQYKCKCRCFSTAPLACLPVPAQCALRGAHGVPPPPSSSRSSSCPPRLLLSPWILTSCHSTTFTYVGEFSLHWISQPWKVPIGPTKTNTDHFL